METEKYRSSTTTGGIQSTALSPEVTKVLRSTYMLLGTTIAFSAIMAGISMAVDAPHFGLFTLLPYFLCLWMTEKNKNSSKGLFWVFALTGWLGFTLGPILNMYMAVKGSEPIMLALGSTALIFFAASAFVLTTRKNLSFMTGFLMTGMLVAFVAAIANVFLQIPLLSLTVSSVFALLSAGIIMWQTSAIIHGGERNYISATVTLFVMVYNLFLSLLQIFGIMGDD
ncbi:MAG: Bax inhibitor-1/YccA family protein [Porticoccaceae bacterium]|jgi:modulator of FtsH protease|nr:Bax inhibitor-1/YccA family protein [Porticoccaceae bacterium]MBT5071284.1 Bax inhibitor-1/YccA family protein [Porticoccaceae bacterium]MBT6779862.1 Bax inhibitor-1/YccA family protein [Porticoccaceae bacterium]MBT7563414.1 Bax inhibitor-1/YccA family protein [Porticoccaceae bacterium]|tara:strand:+ start:1081 stop:1758 length:678 start_codon:yes stop_codon:yes gene_type:complete